MKTQLPNSFIRTLSVIALAATLLFQSCKKDEVIIPPQVTTINASNITFSSATMGGTIKSNGGANITAKGICYATTTAPTVKSDTTNQGAGSQSFSSQITDLLPNTKYFARAYATNSAGTGYGEEFSFTTGAGLPSITLAVTNTTYKEIFANWTITAQGASAVSLSGWVISTTNALPLTGTDVFTSFNTSATFVEKTITDLEIGKKYYVRAFAANGQGTAYSNVVEATTKSLPTATDADGNVYESVLIGTQIWMNKNLKVTKFSNGDPIPTTSTPTQNITAESSPVYRWAPDGNSANVNSFGYLYSGAVATDSRNVCPAGWHVPSKNEWVALQSALGSNPGLKLREASTNYWGVAGTNVYGFAAVGAGMRDQVGTFGFLKTYGEMWASTAFNATDVSTFIVYSTFDGVDQYNRARNTGLAIRCLKD
ncbi:MAG: hypothetical protein HOP30_20660 [Cyclobacteriaceae bacterium]|nr:hypothetical protein [Cyclobacteriaceae bacterium]